MQNTMNELSRYIIKEIITCKVKRKFSEYSTGTEHTETVIECTLKKGDLFSINNRASRTVRIGRVLYISTDWLVFQIMSTDLTPVHEVALQMHDIHSKKYRIFALSSELYTKPRSIVNDLFSYLAENM